MAFSVNDVTTQLRKIRITPGAAIFLALSGPTLPFAATKTFRHHTLKPNMNRTSKLKNPTYLIPGITDLGLRMKPLRDHMRNDNIAAHTWGSKRNNGPTRLGVPKLLKVFENFVEEANEPVILIGHSFGGLMSLYLARRYPDKVKAVILLASPCQLSFNDIESNTVFGKLFKVIEAGKFLFEQEILHSWVGEQDRIPALDIPIISFIACNDKNVNALSCKAPDGPLNRNIFVDCDHGEIKDHEAVKQAITYLYEHGFDAELPQSIIDLGIVDESHVINHFAVPSNDEVVVEYPPQQAPVGVLSIA